MTRFMWCSTSRTVRSKSSRMRRMNPASSSTSSWLSPPAGSSSSSSRGREASARAISTRFCRPYGSSPRLRLAPHPRGPRTRASPAARRVAAANHVAAVRSDDDVLLDRHGREELDVLERPRDAAVDDAVRRRPQQRLPVEDEIARLRLVQPRDHVEERRLAGAVRADQPDDLARVRLDRDVVQRDYPAEQPGDVLDREQGRHPRTLKRFTRADTLDASAPAPSRCGPVPPRRSGGSFRRARKTSSPPRVARSSARTRPTASRRRAAAANTIRCKAGRDVVTADPQDKVAARLRGRQPARLERPVPERRAASTRRRSSPTASPSAPPR